MDSESGQEQVNNQTPDDDNSGLQGQPGLPPATLKEVPKQAHTGSESPEQTTGRGQDIKWKTCEEATTLQGLCSSLTGGVVIM